MKMERVLIAALILTCLMACKEQPQKLLMETPKTNDVVEQLEKKTFVWEGANVYFLLTDRFYNGDTQNDVNFNRTDSTGVLRSFMGGDLKGIAQKIAEGYFTDLGVNAIWFTPIVEQIHGVDKESEDTYGYHGYWTRDWTALDPNFGTEEDLKNLVQTAHSKGIRVMMDVVLNHTGPVTDLDPAWPPEWVRTGPRCDFTDYENCTSCTLVNLPDIITDSNRPVELPDPLLAKWKEEGRLSTELDELQLFFERTKHPRAPRFYIIKWLTDYIHGFGIDGFRVDTVKHADENAWEELFEEASYAFETWKKKHPDDILDGNPFYMVGEVYGYGISGGREYDFGDKKVDYFDHGFKSLINFELKSDAHKDYETVFKKYNDLLHNPLKGKSVLNYLTSHDDMDSFDKKREKPFLAANMLLLTPGASQIYYGDETARSLTVEGATGDANLRSFMNWEDIDRPETQMILAHWQKLGKFRRDHPAVGAGRHNRLAKAPYVFSRSYVNGDFRDKVVIALDLPKGAKSLWVKGFFGDGTKLFDAYSETTVEVKNGKIVLDNDFDTALLELAN